MTALDRLELNDPQTRAATAGGDIVVTAGAGSGKTRTLVGRYLALLEDNVALREIAAITFTEKAAREMRTRIRQSIVNWLAQDPPRRGFWQEAFADLDAARIGTIHSLCAQILREHPAEAARQGVMPDFGVLEEGRAALLRSRAVTESLAWAAEDETALQLFGSLDERTLRGIISTLLSRRLDVDVTWGQVDGDPLSVWQSALMGWLDECLDGPEWRESVDLLAELCADDPADKLELARQAVVAHANTADAARRRGDLAATLGDLAALRAATALTGRSANWPGDTLQTAKDGMRALRSTFDARLAPLVDSKSLASWNLDREAADLLPRLRAVYEHALNAYLQARRAENALDFDDLEANALVLLEDAGVRAAWQASIRAVLVDEFQDTNDRQRQIVYALTGFVPSERSAEQQKPVPVADAPGSLFIVGDAKQSIYRFRGADVTVFRQVQADIKRAGGRAAALDLTFRAHKELVEVTNDLLAPILGECDRPEQPYLVPFAPLTAWRSDPGPGIRRPFVEFLLGLGEGASAGRQAAAEGLAARLLELHDEEQIKWQDVALLFRASTTFAIYEDALEQAGIPFVTVAGRGFYDRPEVRQLLNALSAVANPADDLAMAGLLRSPFVALTDVALYGLRFPPRSIVPRESQLPCALWTIVNHRALPEIVPQADLERALRGRDLISELHRLAGRVPVAALLKRLLDRTHYRAALRAVEGGVRARRNVDKLLDDAHTSGLVSVSEFVEYVRALRDVGARESEAPTEVGSAVQLMTVHKAKGLEFPVVVIADAAHRRHPGRACVFLDDRLGITLDLQDAERRHPAAYLLAALRDAERDEAEDRRLLYVAATRAREKLVISAHTQLLKDGRLRLAGWLERLGKVVGLHEVTVDETPDAPLPLALPGLLTSNDAIGYRLYPWRDGQAAAIAIGPPTAHAAADGLRQDLVLPFVLASGSPTGDGKLDEREADPPRRIWRVVPRTAQARAPAWVVGTLTHAALRHWRFEGAGLAAFLRPRALEMGVVDEALIRDAVRATERMLRRFRTHPLWEELDAAQRWHELPFSIPVAGHPNGNRLENGIIDLLYRVGDQFKIAEFKSDRLVSEHAIQDHIRNKGYDLQVRRYLRAVRSQLDVKAEAFWVFLNVGRQIVVVPAVSPLSG